MSWKKHFSVIKTGATSSSGNIVTSSDGGVSAGSSSKYASYLPEVYAGHPNRIQRYYQYEDMDRDSDINAALDTIADFCTQSEEQNDEPFEIVYNDEATETEVTLLKTNLKIWVKLNNFKQRLWNIFRQTIKNGDQFFLRDPETAEWMWIDHFSVEMVKVDDTRGKEPDEYILRGLDLNRQAKFATKSADPSQYRTPFGTSLIPGSRPQMSPGGQASANNVFQLAGGSRDPRSQQAQHANELSVVDAQNVIHLSLSVGMDINWPFGQSILEPIFKTYKQKELLEDSIIIYRVQRAPERRIFYIDVGNMPPIRAKAHIEQIKNEIHQRRIPNRTGGGSCFVLDTKIPLLDGRTLELQELISEFNSGKQNWVYSCDPETGDFVPGKITWAGVTRKNAQIVKMTLDNGEVILCTPDHKFPILGKGKTEAKDIVPQVDSLISFNCRLYNIDDRKSKENTNSPTYLQVFNHSKKEWNYVHREVANFFKNINEHTKLVFEVDDPKKTVIHHKDYNKYNNNPENLTFMNGYDHFLLHSKTSTYYQSTLTEAQKKSIAKKQSESSKKSWEEWKKNPEQFQKRISTTGKLIKTYIANNPEHKKLLLNNLSDEMNAPWRNQKLVFDKTLLDIVIKTVIENNSERDKTLELLNNNPEFMQIYKSLNAPKNKMISHLSHDEFKTDTLIKLLKNFGYNGWKDFISKMTGDWKRQGRKTRWSKNHLAILVNTYKKEKSQAKVIDSLSNNTEFMSEFRELNNSKNTSHVNFNKFTKEKLISLITSHNYKNWKDFVDKVENYNHKVVSIEFLEDLQDTGTITVDGKEIYHNYHTFALKSGVYTFNSILDAAYNPLSIMDDYFFAQSSEGRGSKVETLAGGDNLGEIGDLTFFSKKMARGLRIPASYLALGDEDQGGGASYNDGKLGAAVIQEFRFNKYCMRLQTMLAPIFDKDFKKFLKQNGIEIDGNLFELRFNPPQNFTKYRQIEVDAAQVGVYQQVADNKKLAERFKLKRFLNLSEEELIENERLWAEENAGKLKKTVGTSPAETEPEGDLSSVGIRMPDEPLGDLGQEGDFGGEEMPPEGGSPTAGGGAGAPPPPEAPPAPAV